MSAKPWSKSRSRSEYLKVWGPLIGVTLLGFVIAWRYVEPAPPDRIRIASGSQDGAYQMFAGRYRELLAPHGIHLEIVPTAGSVENLRLLQSGEVELGLVQGGTAASTRTELVQSLASLYFEPLWVFYRKSLDVRDLSALRGKRIAVGPEGSGAQMLARQLLTASGVTEQTASLLPLGGHAAAAALRAGNLDAALFVSSPQAAAIQELLTDAEVRLMSFRRHLAYRRKFPFLSAVTLGEGAVDLARNLPPQDTLLLAPAAILAARKDIHPALVPLLLDVAGQVHEMGGMFEEPNMFPSNRFTELPMHPDARRYLRSGPTFLYRILPFWAASLADRLKIMLLPFVTLLIPLIKIAPPVYRWRIRSKIYRWYHVLRDIDLKLESGGNSSDLRDEVARLETMEKEVGEVSVPASYMEEFYNLRMHIDLMRKRLEQRAGSQDTPFRVPPRD